MSFFYDLDNMVFGNGRITFRYGFGYLHDGDGASMVEFADEASGERYAFGFDGSYRDGAWDHAKPVFDVPQLGPYSMDTVVRRGHTTTVVRLYRDAPVLQIIYEQNESDWTEDFIRVPGPADSAAFVMYGLDDVVGHAEGRRLWREAEERFGHNHGDHFLSVAGSSVQRCIYEGYFIYGAVSLATGNGVGFVYPTSITTHDWKVWWTEEQKLEIEFAPHGKLGTRWLFAVTDGRDEVMKTGMRLALLKRP